MKGLTRLYRRLEGIMTAVSFAEAGEAETAISILKEECGNSSLRKRLTARKAVVLKPNHS
ncbi:MAG: hypothetical protein AB1499_10035 [Nitrospirota bacterium]